MGDIAATIVQTDLDPAILEQLTQALRTAGFEPVKSAPKLPESLSEPQVLLLDEYIAGEDVSTLLSHLGGRNVGIVVLVSSPYLERITAWMGLTRIGTHCCTVDVVMIKGPPDESAHVDLSVWTTTLPQLIDRGLRRIYRSLRENEEHEEEMRRAATSP